MRIRPISLLALGVFIAPAVGYAQEKGNVGLTMGYPAAVGAVWHVTDTVALRPELSISQSGTESPSGAVGESSNWAVGIGLSALFYVSREDNLRTYVSPRYSYARSSSTSTSVLITTLTNELRTSNSLLAVSVGAQYALSARFAAFGEVGFGYSWGTSRSTLSAIRLEAHNWGTRTGAGVILYF